MNIRYKLTIQFTLIVAAILVVFSVYIFYFSAAYRENDYNKRLTDRANTTARLLLDVAEVDENLLKIIDKNSLALYQEEVYIFDEDNNQIYSNIEEKQFKDTTILREVRKKKNHEFKIFERNGVGILYIYNGRDYVVLSSAYDIYGIAKIKNLKIILFVGLLLSIMVSALAGLIFAGRALAPISTVVGQVKKIKISNLNLRVSEGNKKDEIAQMAITFNEMLARLEEAFMLQRDFVSNAAHELRTPFTVMLAEIDYSLLQERPKEHYKLTLKELSSDLKKLSNLSNGLLDLARLSFDNSSFELKTIRTDEILLEACNDVLKMHIDAHTNLNFENLPENDSLLSILGNEQLIKSAFKNLIENAIKFSNSKTVEILLSTDERSIMVKFCDNGIGIPAQDLKNIFQPFYRGNNTQFIAGYGLGLALTNKVIQLHNGIIKVESEIEKGSVFTVILPNRFNF